MRTLLTCLPAGEPPGLLFKHLFLLKLPGNLRDQVAKKMERLLGSSPSMLTHVGTSETQRRALARVETVPAAPLQSGRPQRADIGDMSCLVFVTDVPGGLLLRTCL